MMSEFQKRSVCIKNPTRSWVWQHTQAYNPSTLEAEIGGWQVQGQPGFLNEILFEKKKIQKE
jgi:hypothetical protein